jgi:elongation factor 2
VKKIVVPITKANLKIPEKTRSKMVKIDMEKLRSLMDDVTRIRNLSVIAHVDHGKTTLTDTLLVAGGIMASNRIGSRGTDTMKEEIEGGITIKSTGVSLYYQDSEGKEFLINLIDSPGHVDFNSEVTAALRLTDGALVVVDCIEGSCVQTETVLRQALTERVKPVLVVNKIDRTILEKQLSSEEIYQTLLASIFSVNSTIATFQDDIMGDLTVDPLKGTVCFSSAKQGWAFTLNQFAEFYEKKLKVDRNKILQRLWGENYYDDETKRWTESPYSLSGKKLVRGFCHYIMEPIMKIYKNANDIDSLSQLLSKIDVPMTKDLPDMLPNERVKTVLKKWLPAGEALFRMISVHLPSPKEAMPYRTEILYTGPANDETAISMRNCDPKGPLVYYVSKMVPALPTSKFYAFGRVFSGSLSSTKKVIIMGPDYKVGSKADLFPNVNAKRVVLMMVGKVETIEDVPCGNTCGVVGIDNYLVKGGTVVSDPNSFPLQNVKHSVAPVVRSAVAVKNPADLPDLVDALKRLTRADTLAEVHQEESGEFTIACAGELHLKICLSQLKGFLGNVELRVSEPTISYRETVTKLSNSCLAKSPNKHNRIYATAEPIVPELALRFETEKWEMMDEKKRARTLIDEFKWDDDVSTRRIWAFGPILSPTNIICDATKSVAFMNEIKESVIGAFTQFTSRGILCNEPLRGVKWVIQDCVLHPDSIHRGPGAMIPATQRVLSSSMLSAKPTLMEPIFLVEVQTDEENSNSMHKLFNRRRGKVLEMIPRHGGQCIVKAFMPAQESFGFSEELRKVTSGHGNPQFKFDHWEVFPGDIDDPDSKLNKLVTSIRNRKGLGPIPAISNYLDKL